MFKYYQPNKKDLKDKEGDCAIRCLTKFYNIEWVEAFDLLVKYARESQTIINSLTNIRNLFEDKQIKYDTIYSKKLTVSEFAKKYNTGTYALYIKVGFRTHLVTVVDGIYYDTWDCGKKYVYGYWMKEVI